MVQQTGPCPTCELPVDLDNIKVELEKVKQDLALATSGEQQEGEQHYQDIRDIWVRWEEIKSVSVIISLSLFQVPETGEASIQTIV